MHQHRLSVLLLLFATLWFSTPINHGFDTFAEDTMKPPQPEEGFEFIFDGKTLDGWEGYPHLWSVENGAIVGEIDGKAKNVKGNTFLIWKAGKVENFELRLQYRIVGNNSGIQYRSTLANAKTFAVRGYQADIAALTIDKNTGQLADHDSGLLFEERGRLILANRGERTTIQKDGTIQQREKIGEQDELLALVKRDDWNDYTIIAQGNKLRHFINGQLMCEVIDDQEDKRAMAGILALQLRGGPPMRVEFKNIRIKRL